MTDKLAEANSYLLKVIHEPAPDIEANKDDLLIAMEIYQEILDEGDSAEANIGLAYIACAYQDIRTACVFLKTALTVVPGHPDALRMLDDIRNKYASSPEEGTESLSIVNKLVNDLEEKTDTKPQSKLTESITGVLGTKAKGLTKDNDFFSMLQQARKPKS